MLFNEDFIVCNYRISVVINNINIVSFVDDNLERVSQQFDEVVQSYKDDDRHIVISLYDYDKQTNIKYYDSEEEK